MQVDINNDSTKGEFTTIAVCNARYYGGGYKISPHSSLTDGLLEVYLVTKTSKPKMAKVILSMKDGSHEKSPIVRRIQTDKLTITADKPISANIDGEELTSDNFNIEIIPEGIEIYYNQSLIDDILQKDKSLSLRKKK